MIPIDPHYLKNEQYKDSSRLAARARLHADYNRNPYGWFQWLFDHYRLPDNARVLEVGGGPGWLWRLNAGRIPAGWQITLSDFSAGMLAEQHSQLAAVPHSFAFAQMDAQALPFVSATFDAVIANHMLYHVPDRAKAISEMRRVLKPGGLLYTATNGEIHLQEIRQLLARFESQTGEWTGVFNMPRRYTLENAPDQLRAQFAEVEVLRYEDAIVIPDSEPLVAYVLSGRTQLSPERIAALRTFIQAEIDKQGVLPITKDMGLLIAR